MWKAATRASCSFAHHLELCNGVAKFNAISKADDYNLNFFAFVHPSDEMRFALWGQRQCGWEHDYQWHWAELGNIYLIVWRPAQHTATSFLGLTDEYCLNIYISVCAPDLLLTLGLDLDLTSQVFTIVSVMYGPFWSRGCCYSPGKPFLTFSYKPERKYIYQSNQQITWAAWFPTYPFFFFPVGEQVFMIICFLWADLSIPLPLAQL